MAVAAIVRRCDRDRFQTVLFAPAARRAALFALYAFNYEIARVRESVREPALGRIRLEWWRETVAALYEGAPPRRHPVALALGEAVRTLRPSRALFDRLLAARAADLDDAPPASLTALEEYAEGTSSALVLLALEILGTREVAAAETGRHAGIAYALAGLLRAMPLLTRAGRQVIPSEIAALHRLDLAGLQTASSAPALRAAAAEIAAAACRHLAQARAGRRAIPPPALAALLPTVITARVLRRLARAGFDPFDPSVARPDPMQSWRIAFAALRGRF